MVFLVHPLPANHRSLPVKTLTDPRQTDALEVGELVQAWGHLFQWTEHSLPHRELDRYAQLADPLVDAWIESLPADALASQDTLAVLATAAEHDDAHARACWEEVSKPAPDGIAVDADEWDEGSGFFWQNAGLIFTSLLHFSLAGGFSAPRITRHLHAASYLIPPVDKTGLAYCPITDASRERTRGRLAETGQFVLDVMGCPLPLLDTATEKEKHYVATRLSLGPESLSPPARGSFALAGSGEAWQASVRVRLLHAVARRRVALKLARSKADGEGVDDVALNQEDMIGTLASFAVAPLWCLERLGAASPVLTADGEGAGRRAYIRLWRHIGFYLGVPEEILRSHFSSYLPAGSLLASLVVDIFPPSGLHAPAPSTNGAAATGCPLFAGAAEDDGHPHPTLPPPTLPVLEAISDQPPVRTSLAHHEGLTRVLIGDELGDYLGLSRGTWKSQAKLNASMLLLVYPSWFADWYPSPRWRTLRRDVIREALGRMLKMQLSLRRSLFRPRDAQGELSAEARDAERVSRDLVGAKRLGKRYWAMVGEMLAVTVGVGALSLFGAVGAARWVLGLFQ